ncbi:MAG: hypothetical protein HeimAB125_15290 [Candidatus Heimdallarchaeota archaeon AB_125]|nr:MAG: hypothetical protein HeimAB125_15290 [Candidatus Heimdallarchaeota archaeon AB_125]
MNFISKIRFGDKTFCTNCGEILLKYTSICKNCNTSLTETNIKQLKSSIRKRRKIFVIFNFISLIIFLPIGIGLIFLWEDLKFTIIALTIVIGTFFLLSILLYYIRIDPEQRKIKFLDERKVNFLMIISLSIGFSMVTIIIMIGLVTLIVLLIMSAFLGGLG